MTDHIAFISSDSRALYKLDVFHFLSFPLNYVSQFRYEQEYLSDEITDNLNDLKDSEGVIYFMSGNDLHKDVLDRELEIIPVRKVRVHDCYLDGETGLVIFYLCALEFVDYNQSKYIDSDCIVNEFKETGNVVFKSKNVLRPVSWQVKVSSLEKYYSGSVFFNFEILDENKLPLDVTYNNGQLCKYRLIENCKYIFKINLIDNTEAITGEFNSKLVTDDATITFPENYKINCRKDSRMANIIVHSVEKESTPGVLVLSSTYSLGTSNNLNIEIVLSQTDDKWKFYGLFSSGIAFVLIMGQVLARMKEIPFFTKLFGALAISAIFGICSGFLYKMFRKK